MRPLKEKAVRPPLKLWISASPGGHSWEVYTRLTSVSHTSVETVSFFGTLGNIREQSSWPTPSSTRTCEGLRLSLGWGHTHYSLRSTRVLGQLCPGWGSRLLRSSRWTPPDTTSCIFPSQRSWNKRWNQSLPEGHARPSASQFHAPHPVSQPLAVGAEKS